MSQFAVFIACQMPFKFGRPSAALGARYAGACCALTALSATSSAADTDPIPAHNSRVRMWSRPPLIADNREGFLKPENT
jgi:hypothetical protein